MWLPVFPSHLLVMLILTSYHERGQRVMIKKELFYHVTLIRNCFPCWRLTDG